MVNLHLKRSTWTLITGVAAAGVVLVAGAMNANRLQEKALKASICDLPVPTKEVREAPLTAAEATKPFDPDAYLQEKRSTIDPEIAEAVAEETAEKAEAKRIADCRAKVGNVPDDAQISRSKRWPMQAAAVIAILGALPWAWYFLLRRIAELRGAFGGNPPAG